MLETLDIKTLKTVHILCMTGSVTKTADLLNLSPGAVSYVLNKARKITGTALFVRTKNGMEPDTFARELSSRYQALKMDLSAGSEAATLSNRPFVISSYSLAELLISLSVIDSKKNYPEIIFHRQGHNEAKRVIKLRNREVDLDVGSRLPADKSITQLNFFIGNSVILVSQNHPTIKDTVTMDDWQSNRHAVWLRGMHFANSDFDGTNQFNEVNSQRKVAFTSSSTLNLINLCAFSDTLILIPERVGKKVASVMPVKILPPPVELDMRFDCYIHFHHSMSGNETMKSLVELFHTSLGC
ncbi:LysR family transcriptional regulator [Enterobacteriaceae bacterium H11S18]|uniref:LysR family transcriptional regulator n=1 Tax=Dryocola clanedunensis TaxID=2925396 RepID=UPI0022F0BCE7|nr:LysR family transcriptional regulator [Dryocola clanedunensis]MCT4710300.1 LysR family transcriptional regulator [Dryocola clanedunensis]